MNIKGDVKIDQKVTSKEGFNMWMKEKNWFNRLHHTSSTPRLEFTQPLCKPKIYKIRKRCRTRSPA